MGIGWGMGMENHTRIKNGSDTRMDLSIRPIPTQHKKIIQII